MPRAGRPTPTTSQRGAESGSSVDGHQIPNANSVQPISTKSASISQAIPRRKPVPTTHSSERLAHRRRAGVLSRFSRRTIIIAAITLTALLILIIGLAAGLSTRSKSQDLPLPSANGGPYTGDLTYYGPGLGACGVTSSNGDSIVSVSHLIFDAVSVGSNPNDNPLCGKMIRAKRGGVSVDLKVVDRCTGCQARDLDVTEDTFAKLANVDLGRVKVKWSWLSDVPGAAGGAG